MKITKYISDIIKELPDGFVFSYTDFMAEDIKPDTIIKALNRMASAGKISKLSKGKFYKPKSTVFGTIGPNEREIVKDLLYENGKPIGYLTGYSIFNRLALTTQVSAVIQIGANTVRPAFKRGFYRISFIRQKNEITKENIPLLQILDSIRYIKKIPDSPVESSCKRFVSILKKLTDNEKNMIVGLAEKYPRSTRALLGALFEEIGAEKLTVPLKNYLNPVTKYKLPGAVKALKYAKKWDIV
jgi:hypothetical protein